MIATEGVTMEWVSIQINRFDIIRSTGDLEDEVMCITVLLFNDIIFFQKAKVDLLDIMSTIPKYLLVLVYNILCQTIKIEFLVFLLDAKHYYATSGISE